MVMLVMAQLASELIDNWQLE